MLQEPTRFYRKLKLIYLLLTEPLEPVCSLYWLVWTHKFIVSLQKFRNIKSNLSIWHRSKSWSEPNITHRETPPQHKIRPKIRQKIRQKISPKIRPKTLRTGAALNALQGKVTVICRDVDRTDQNTKPLSSMKKVWLVLEWRSPVSCTQPWLNTTCEHYSVS